MQQHMVLNGTSDNLYNVEKAGLDVCSSTLNMCTVLSIFDMCKDMKESELIRKRVPKKKGATQNYFNDKGEENKLDVPYWYIAGTNSIIASELLERFMARGVGGVISFPVDLAYFEPGKLEHALGAQQPFSLCWHQEKIELDDDTLFYSSMEHERMLGRREKTTFDATMGSETDLYKGEWLKGTETRQGFGTLVRDCGTRYEGFFVNNRFHGRGKMTYFAKDNKVMIYKGCFNNDQKHGFGTVYLSKGDRYKTKWNRNKMQNQGVYIWANNIKARVIFDEDNLVFCNRRIFPANDYRLEYRGNIFNGHVMHGDGTLTLKGGKTYSGDWIYAVLKKYEIEIMGFRHGWNQKFSFEAEIEKKKLFEENQERILNETITYKRDNDQAAWLTELNKLFFIDKRLQYAKDPPRYLTQ